MFVFPFSFISIVLFSLFFSSNTFSTFRSSLIIFVLFYFSFVFLLISSNVCGHAFLFGGEVCYRHVAHMPSHTPLHLFLLSSIHILLIIWFSNKHIKICLANEDIANTHKIISCTKQRMWTQIWSKKYEAIDISWWFYNSKFAVNFIECKKFYIVL